MSDKNKMISGDENAKYLGDEYERLVKDPELKLKENHYVFF